jgi:hypothetical protein
MYIYVYIYIYIRDLMKAAQRCTSHSPDFNKASGTLTEELRRFLLCEVIDVFAAAVRDKERERGIIILSVP